jgi:hypothetical protein
LSSTAVLFANYTLTGSTQDQGRLISFGQDWIGVGLIVASVSAGAQATFKLQWSSDNATWTDDPTPFATVTAAGPFVGKFQIRNLYWRLAVTVTGSQPAITCSAAAIY